MILAEDAPLVNGLMAAGGRIASFLKLLRVESCAPAFVSQRGYLETSEFGSKSYLSAAGFLAQFQERVELGPSSDLLILYQVRRYCCRGCCVIG